MYRRVSIRIMLALGCLLVLVGCGSSNPVASPASDPASSPVLLTPEAQQALPTDVPPLAAQAGADGAIMVRVQDSARPVDQRLFGTNLPAWLNTDGFANTTLLERTIASGTTLLRMPGGSWSNIYPWLDCQLERAEPCTWAARPSDFIELLEAVDIPGMWTVSFNGTAEEAAALVAFFNAEADDMRPIGLDPRGVDWKTVGYWAQLRSDLGYPDPVGIQLWEVGNEIYGGKPGTGKDCADWGWEDGWTCDGLEYVEGLGTGAERRQGFIEFRDKMRTVDPSILVGAVGIPLQKEWSNWGNEVIAGAGQVMDFYSIHQYAYFEPPRTLEDVLAEPQQTWPRIANDVRRGFAQYADGREVPIAVTEYNLFAFQDFDRERLMTRAVNMLHLADTIGQMAEVGFAMANQWNLANGVTDQFGNYGILDAGSLERYPQYYVFPLWSRFGSTLLPVESTFDASRELSIYAGRPEDGVVSLMVINKAPVERTATIMLNGIRAVTGGTVDTAQAASLEAMSVSFNGVDNPANDLSDAPALPLEGLSPLFNYSFTPYSITLLRIEVTP